jgi:hypothetical protein
MQGDQGQPGARQSSLAPRFVDADLCSGPNQAAETLDVSAEMLGKGGTTARGPNNNRGGGGVMAGGRSGRGELSTPG